MPKPVQSSDEYVTDKLLAAAIKAVAADIKFEKDNNDVESLPEEVEQEIIMEVSVRIGRFVRQRLQRTLREYV